MPSSEACPAPDVLEGIAIGQVPPEGLREHLAACDACQQTLQRIRDDNRFLAAFAVDGALPAAVLTEPACTIDIPGYQVVREIHRGGQGVVYQARQRSTKRDVAVKVMKQGPFATLADRARFDREIETLGRLDHPNIVAVHDAGTIAGFQYLVMDYVDGPPLDDALRDGAGADVSLDANGRMNPRERVAAILRVFIKVCDAVHAAHLRGVIHRDLKPSNVRVDRAGEPHVLDFGLATSTDGQQGVSMTQTGQFVGSLPWASPEQVEGVSSKIDLRTDVYSLGAILFELLTGRVPFDVGSNMPEAFENILHAEPPRLTTLSARGGLPIDNELETIVLKCLEKSPPRRYQSAGELARDLRRYLAGEAIEAKRDSAMYVLRKILRRHRIPVAGAVGFVVLLAVFGALMAVLYQRSARLEHDVRGSAESLAELLSHSNINQGRMAGLLGNMFQAETLLWQELLAHREAGDGGAVHLNDPPGSPVARWGLWELYRRFPCRLTLRLPPVEIRCATLAADGAGVWAVDSAGVVQQFDAFGARLDSYQVRRFTTPGWPIVSATGDTVLWTDGTRVSVWSREAGDEPLHDASQLAIPEIDGFNKSLDGARFTCVSDGVAIVWDFHPPAEVARFSPGGKELVAAAITADGTRLACRDVDGRLYLWGVESGELISTVAPPAPTAESRHIVGELLFSPDGRFLADAWIDTPGRIWDFGGDPPTSIELSESPGDRRVQAFSPDGRLLAIGDLVGAVRVYETWSGRRVSSFVAHTGRVWSVCFTADGRRIWSSSGNALRLWDAVPDAGVRIVQVSGEIFHTADFTPDGASIVAGGGLGRLHCIDAASLAVSTGEFGSEAIISSVTVSADGGQVAASTYANALFIWDESRRGAPSRRLVHPHRISHASFSPDGARVVSGCDDGVVRVWRTADARIEHEFQTHASRVPQVDYDPSGRHVAAAVRDGTLQVWDVQTGERETWRQATGVALRAVRYAADGLRLVTAGADRTVDVWDVKRRTRVASLFGHNQEIYCVDVSRDGHLIASGDAGGVIYLWNATHDRPLVTLEGHTAAVMSVRFAPDGRSLVSTSLDGTLRVWDLGYYAPHIAGNVDAQLQSLNADSIDPARAAAWRQWAADALGSASDSD